MFKLCIKIVFVDFFNLRLATTGIKQLPPDVYAAAQNSALWSKDEEHILANIPAVCCKVLCHKSMYMYFHVKMIIIILNFRNCPIKVETPKSSW